MKEFIFIKIMVVVSMLSTAAFAEVISTKSPTPYPSPTPTSAPTMTKNIKSSVKIISKGAYISAPLNDEAEILDCVDLSEKRDEYFACQSENDQECSASKLKDMARLFIKFEGMKQSISTTRFYYNAQQRAVLECAKPPAGSGRVSGYVVPPDLKNFGNAEVYSVLYNFCQKDSKSDTYRHHLNFRCGVN